MTAARGANRNFVWDATGTPTRRPSARETTASVDVADVMIVGGDVDGGRAIWTGRARV
jgi:hypothetical protein